MQENVINSILKYDNVTSKIFKGVYARDELPLDLDFPSCFILNTHPRSKPGEHWLALYYDPKGNCYFFDSYGMHPTFYRLKTYISKTTLVDYKVFQIIVEFILFYFYFINQEIKQKSFLKNFIILLLKMIKKFMIF